MVDWGHGESGSIGLFGASIGIQVSENTSCRNITCMITVSSDCTLTTWEIIPRCVEPSNSQVPRVTIIHIVVVPGIVITYGIRRNLTHNCPNIFMIISVSIDTSSWPWASIRNYTVLSQREPKEQYVILSRRYVPIVSADHVDVAVGCLEGWCGNIPSVVSVVAVVVSEVNWVVVYIEVLLECLALLHWVYEDWVGNVCAATVKCWVIELYCEEQQLSIGNCWLECTAYDFCALWECWVTPKQSAFHESVAEISSNYVDFNVTSICQSSTQIVLEKHQTSCTFCREINNNLFSCQYLSVWSQLNPNQVWFTWSGVHWNYFQNLERRSIHFKI